MLRRARFARSRPKCPAGILGGIPFCLANGVLRRSVARCQSWAGVGAVGAGLGSLSNDCWFGGGGGGAVDAPAPAAEAPEAAGLACWGTGCGATGCGGPARFIASSCCKVLRSSVGWADLATRSLSEGGAGFGGLTCCSASGGRFRYVRSFCFVDLWVHDPDSMASRP